MNVEDAIGLLTPAIATRGGVWVDFGAGTGLFTRALATLVGPEGKVVAVDRDAHAISALRASKNTATASSAEIIPVKGDFLFVESLAELIDVRLAGALFANALHYTPDAAPVLSDVAGRLAESGRIIVVEYERSSASPLVPYPIPTERLRSLASRAMRGSVQIVGRRKSRYGGAMYCAVLEHTVGSNRDFGPSRKNVSMR